MPAIKNTGQAWVPQPYMLQGVEWLLTHACAGLFLKPGMKKTSITLCAFSELVKAKKAKRMLVVSPLKVAWEVWPEEIKKWSRFNHLRCVVLHGEEKEEELTTPAEVYVVNMDGLAWLLADRARFLKLGIDTLTVDESSFFRHTNTVRFKILKKVLNTFARRWILTGTPKPKSYLDLFPQMYIVDMGYSLGPFITHYRHEFFDPTGYGGYTWKLKEGAAETIQKLIAPLVLYLEREDYVKMPRLVEHVVRVELPVEARRVYDELEEEMLSVLGGGETITALSAGVATMKCCQVANGGIYHQPEAGVARLSRRQSWTNLHHVKVAAVKRIIKEATGAVLVAYEFEHDLDRLLKVFGKRAVVMGSAGTKKEREVLKKLIVDWNAGRIPLLLTQKQRASHGLNMQYGTCRTVVWHSETWDLEQYIQLNERIWREGNPAEQVDVYLVTARDTVDEVKLRSLRTKNKSQTGFLTALKEYALERRKSNKIKLIKLSK